MNLEIGAGINGEDLSEKIISELNYKNMLATVNHFSHLYRYTGHPDGEAAVDYLVAKLDEYGITADRLFYDAYLSLPLDAKVDMFFPSEKSVKVIAAVYSGEAKGLAGDLLYDGWSNERHSGQEEYERHFEPFKGKIVLTRTGGGKYAIRAARAGALAVIHMWPSGEDLHHHSSIGTVWGTPTPAERGSFPFIPYVEMTKRDGEDLLRLLGNGPVRLSLNVKMDNGIRRSSMPIVNIPGKSRKFVLISGHYDSWYEGITDNAVSDAILLEFARVFHQHRNLLNRSVKIAWWSGHSDGRYAGSTWYCDSHWEELSSDCVAHINIDLAGCRNADQVRVRTTLMEGSCFTDRMIREFAHHEPKPYIPMVRGADQSFWGVGIPLSIMPKYEAIPEKSDFRCPSGGPWWHTDADTIDKLDETFMIRDAKLNAKIASLILNSDRLPVNLTGFLGEMTQILNDIDSKLEDEFDLTPVYGCLHTLEDSIVKLEEAMKRERDTDEILKLVAGELVRIVYSSSSPYYQDPAVEQMPFPLLRKACNATPSNCSAGYYLFLQTEFLRQRNRLVGQMKRIIKDIDHQLLKWQAEE